jgi:hypothetical protein
MPHKHSSRDLTLDRRHQQLVLIGQLAKLLWDDTQPDGQKAIPEERWEEILAGPCKNDRALIQAVCKFERELRLDLEIEDGLSTESPARTFEEFLSLALERIPLLRLLRNASEGKWYPEDQWDMLLENAEEKVRNHIKTHARRLQEEEANPWFWTFFSA